MYELINNNEEASFGLQKLFKLLMYLWALSSWKLELELVKRMGLSYHFEG